MYKEKVNNVNSYACSFEYSISFGPDNIRNIFFSLNITQSLSKGRLSASVLMGLDLLFFGVGSYLGLYLGQHYNWLLPTLTGPEDMARALSTRVTPLMRRAEDSLCRLWGGANRSPVYQSLTGELCPEATPSYQCLLQDLMPEETIRHGT